MDRVPPQTHWQLLYWSFSVSRILLILLRSGSILLLDEFQNEISILVNRIFVAFSIIDSIETRETGSPVATASSVSSISSTVSSNVSEIAPLVHRLSSTTAT